MGSVFSVRKKKTIKKTNNKNSRYYTIVRNAVKERENPLNRCAKVAQKNLKKIVAKNVEKIVLTTCRFVTFA
jgi:hypothetical protein